MAHPCGMSPLHRRGCNLVVPKRVRDRRPEVGLISHNKDRDLREDLFEDLEYLTADIDASHIDDLPRWTRRNVVGVGEQCGCLLRKVARVVACYHDSRAPHD